MPAVSSLNALTTPEACAVKLPVRITVNGRMFEREVEPRLLLVHFLREVAALTGTKVGLIPASAARAPCSSTTRP
jgi:carbon-monoxide dehydrogenase small subunit